MRALSFLSDCTHPGHTWTTVTFDWLSSFGVEACTTYWLCLSRSVHFGEVCSRTVMLALEKSWRVSP